jgi:DNA processing protein
MTPIRRAATILAALELLPGEPHDLTGLLRNEDAAVALVTGEPTTDASPLLNYLRRDLDNGRVELWTKRLDELATDKAITWDIISDPTYPRALSAVYDAPPILFRRGVPVADLPAVAIVGSRDADNVTLDATREIAALASAHELTVISGLAEGVDTASHQGTLAVHGSTVAVTGTGIDSVFPTCNTDLAERIASRGTVLSQFAPGTPRTGTTFLRRNSVIAALGAVSLVMAAAERSGSRHQAEQAMRYGRHVLLWAPRLGDQAWARELAAAGHATFTDSPDAALRQLRRLTADRPAA